MSYQVLARKWRPKRFQEVIGQEHITRSLQNALKDGKLGHAYLFTGTRGIGKTSIARILAKAIRCENLLPDGNPCNECETCKTFSTESSLDVVEIDGASNNSVDNIRELISNIQYLPTKGQYRVYIVDEVHMLSTSAFNALLKTLEEPPAHIKFLFATTEPQKLLGTVLSRCQRFEFRNAEVEDLKRHIKNIAEHEKIRFQNEDIIEQLCKAGNGSVRDTLSLFDQVLSYTENDYITEDALVLSIGIAKLSIIQNIVASIFKGEAEVTSQLLHQTLRENVSVKKVTEGILNCLYGMIAHDKLPEGISKAEALWIFESIAKDSTWMIDSLLPNQSIDLLLRKMAIRREVLTPLAPSKKKIDNETNPAPEQVEVQEKIRKIVIPVEELVESRNVEGAMQEREIEDTKKDASEGYERTWDGFLGYLSENSPATASNLEQGNIISPLLQEAENVSVEIGFADEAEVFLEYLQGATGSQKLKEHMALFFGVSEKNIFIRLTHVNEEEKERSDFKSKVEIKEKEEEKQEELDRQEILNDPMVLKAEELFNSKIDKVVLGRTL